MDLWIPVDSGLQVDVRRKRYNNVQTLLGVDLGVGPRMYGFLDDEWRG